MSERRRSRRRAKRIAVLSDLHIDSDANPESWANAQGAFRHAAALDVDHVVVCGDLFDSSIAFTKDAGLVHRFLRRLGLWRSKRLTIGATVFLEGRTGV